MTIFDAIRYPIGNTPTKEEFEALPEEFLRRWAAAVGFSSNVTELRYETLLSMITIWFEKAHAQPDLWRNASSDLQTLRRMIGEME